VPAEYRLDRSRIQLLENEADCGVGWRARPFQTKEVSQASEMDVEEAVDAAVRVGSGDDRQNGKQDHVWQAIQFAFSPTRILDLGQQGEQRRERPHGKLNMSNQVARSRSQRFCVGGILCPITKRHLARGVAFRTHLYL